VDTIYQKFLLIRYTQKGYICFKVNFIEIMQCRVTAYIAISMVGSNETSVTVELK